ncbi:hypothetical protein BOW53_07940 [Solemya pervernicosa gill symbiont]|uniref:Uncharacterized protein n=2 Tax=Gammaproteobacteria incertae sedis TaxID=118884 RepID=A0A1T2L5Q5_9GAMM|nr:hypothetical protein [Candidatus Reidiella endopervernicosa]OOZ40392.1 hypothetical protein BOW53_07940 [Solemya pervernicosa gill symbiont]QKQ25567.1 hypothetical protein HUE57_04060 [Candidatus Reidiella endopervernicosa]
MDKQSGNNQIPLPTTTLWAILFASFFIMLGMLFYLFANVIEIAPIPSLQPTLFYGGLAVAAVVLLVSKSLANRSRLEAEGRQGSGNPLSALMLPIALAEAPAMIGALHFLLGGDLMRSLLLVAASVILFLVNKP